MPTNNIKQTNSDSVLLPVASAISAGAASLWESQAGKSQLIWPSNDEARFYSTNQSGLSAYFHNTTAIPAVMTRKRQTEMAAKKLFDVCFAASTLLALAPLLLFVAILIRSCDNGPVFFRQERVGKDGKPFKIFKFRSMYVSSCDSTGEEQTHPVDARVMPIGSFIRRTSIDELPQLINVLKGDMSLVGPRPHVAGQRAGDLPYRNLVPYYDARYAMLPGLTGWAQANGFRGSTLDKRTAKARVDHDIAYIQNFSFLLDLKIIVRTAAREFVTGTGY